MNLRKYNTALFQSDLLGGISVAALSIPVGVAYSEIAGLPPESGLYTAIIALLAYFILGSSKQVIIGPDSATITIFATTVLALTGSQTEHIPQFIMLVTVMTGLIMFIAGFLKLGFISNFLSRPILLGYLNGVSVVLIASQLGKLTGIHLESDGIIRKVMEVFEKSDLLNWPTLFLGLASILFLYFVKRISVKIPSQLILLIITALFAGLFHFKSLGIQFMNEIKNPYPSMVFPDFKLLFSHFKDIFLASAAVMFVSFSGEIPVVQAFSKDNKGFNPNREFFALGLADVLIGFFKGYPISGADSRTAVNVAVGGKTKVVNLVAAALMLLVVIIMPGVFGYLPLVSFGAIIVFAAIGMFKGGAGLLLYPQDKREFFVFAICFLGVLFLGVYQGIIMALVLSFIELISLTSKPKEYEMVYNKASDTISEFSPGLESSVTGEVLIYRFNAPLIFFNSEYFCEMLLKRAAAKPNLKIIVIDAKPVNIIDLTSLPRLGELVKDFNENNITVIFSGANEIFKSAVEKEFRRLHLDTDIFYPGVHGVFMKYETDGTAKH